MYQTNVNGIHHELGTSGFLYRSNQLMYDHATKSMWSTLQGKPVIGALVDKGIELKRLHLVTTTWGQWKKNHPDTTVLSVNTGHSRDYGEGVAYRDYFGTDELMFTVPKLDKRLKNKDEVVALRDNKQQMALAAKFLIKNPVYHQRLGEKNFVVLTDKSGANRVFYSDDVKFKSWDNRSTAIDEKGRKWIVGESELKLDDKTTLKRMPSHRAFWFGWYAQYPDTKLIK